VPHVDPSCTDQTTAVFDVPVTLAEKARGSPSESEYEVGETATATTLGGGGLVTVTVALALLDASAWLVATTV